MHQTRFTGKQARKLSNAHKPRKSPAHPILTHPDRRNPGRNDGRTYRASQFVCPDKVEDSYESDSEATRRAEHAWADMSELYALEKRAGPLEVNLEEIAKPGKPRARKGIARDYEVLERIQAVLALSDADERDPDLDDDFSDMGDWESQLSFCDCVDEEWDDVSPAPAQKSYSEVVMATPG